MKLKLVNSAMMPQVGCYFMSRLDQEEFTDILKDAHDNGDLESYIGYPSTAHIIREMTGCTIEVSREKVTLNPEEDQLLVMRLKYRLQDPTQKKNHAPTANDFEYFWVYFTNDEPYRTIPYPRFLKRYYRAGSDTPETNAT